MSYSPYVILGTPPDIKVGVWYDDEEMDAPFIWLRESLPSRSVAYSFINYLNGGEGKLYLKWLEEIQ